MKWVNVFLSLMFLFFAILQYNDPDPFLWIPLYLLPAFLCWQASRGKHPRYLYVIVMSICVIYGAYLLFDKNGVLSWANEHAAESLVHTMKAEKPWIEESREFGGLVIIFFAMLLNYLLSRKNPPKKYSPHVHK